MKPCIILVEGMNIANRSLVAKEIASHFPAEQLEKYECAGDTPPHLYVHMMRDALEGSKTVVIENGWVADAVMHGMGEKYKCVRQFRRMLDRIALAGSAQIAYCVADSRTYATNWAKIDPDTPYNNVAPMIERMSRAWEEINTSGISVTRVYTGDDSFKMDVEILIDKAQLKASTNRGPGIGNWNPGKVVLLVGDRHGPSIQPYKVDWNLAFCDMAKAGASYWLSDKLDLAGISERHLYWINAYNKNDEATDPEFVKYLQPTAVLCLGDIAARWCEVNNIKHESFRHPQYHKRFQYNEPYPLIEKLKQLVGEL